MKRMHELVRDHRRFGYWQPVDSPLCAAIDSGGFAVH
jgi:hypothetical protein